MAHGGLMGNTRWRSKGIGQVGDGDGIWGHGGQITMGNLRHNSVEA